MSMSAREKMDTWERVTRRTRKILYKTHRAEVDYKNKCARLYRISNFNNGPIPIYPYEGKEEILINGEKAIVKKVGTGYFKLKEAVEKAISQTKGAYLAKESPEETRYFWNR